MSEPSPAPSPASLPATRPCANCGHALVLPEPPFCPQCGQETRIRAPKLGEFLQQFGGAYFATEGALWRTLKLLLFKPGELTRQYLAGRRKHYVLPLRLYLTISLVVLLALRIVASLGIETAMQSETAVKIDAPEQAQAWNYNLLSFGPAYGAGVKDGRFFCNGYPPWMCKRLERRLATNPEQVRGMLANLGERFVANLGLAMFVLVPSFALWLKLVYWNRRLHYTEHLVFALHVHAFWFVAVALTLVDTPWLTGLAVTAVPIYTMLAMRRVYGGRFWRRLLRAGLIFALQILALSVAMALLLVGILLA
jgi:hypothetical protein